MSCSSLRYAESLVQALKGEEKDAITGADVFGPMDMQPTQSHYFWYGIHAVEMLFAVMVTETAELITGVWADGRIGTVRGSRGGSGVFGALIHCTSGTRYADVQASGKPWYASLLEQVMVMFSKQHPVLEAADTLEMISFIEAAEESRLKSCNIVLG